MSNDTAQGYRALQARVNNDMEILLKRFENIMQLAPVEKKDKNIAAAESFQVETHASAMVRAAEDLLALTRNLKEAWLFGQLGSGFDGKTTETDQDAAAVGDILRRMATAAATGEGGGGGEGV